MIQLNLELKVFYTLMFCVDIQVADSLQSIVDRLIFWGLTIVETSVELNGIQGFWKLHQ